MRVRSPWFEGIFVALAALGASFVLLAGSAWAQSVARLSISPRAAQVGQLVTVSGHGFRPRLQGVIAFGGQRVASFRAGPTGRFPVSFVIPAGHSRRLRVVGVQHLRNRRGSLLRLSRAAVSFQVPHRGARAPSGEPPLGSARPHPRPTDRRGRFDRRAGTPQHGRPQRNQRRRRLKEPPKEEGSKEPPKEEGSKELPKEETSGGSWWIPPKSLTWYWQLQGTVNNSEPVAAYDIDGFDNSAGEVSTLHGQGKHVICYIDVGTAENWRSGLRLLPGLGAGQLQRLAGRAVA